MALFDTDRDRGKEQVAFLPALAQLYGSAPVDLLWCWGGAGKLHLCNINFNPCTPEGAPVYLPEYFAVPVTEQQGLALTIKEQERLALALLY